jgi:hypothetical protein
MPTPLEITFHGPFVFRFGINNAWAYAPNCDEHYLNILTDKEDVDLPLDLKGDRIRTFKLTGPTPGETVSRNPDSIITYAWNNKTWPDADTYWNYVLSFPAPDYIYGLVPEYVWIYGYDPNVLGAYYARALRFMYYDSPIPPQFDELANNQITANHLGSASGYSIEIRYNHYHSVPRKKAEYFADAQSCFESMREKLPPCDKWKAFYGEDPAKPKHYLPFKNKNVRSGGTSGPHDCGAAVMAMEDGISLKPFPTEK